MYRINTKRAKNVFISKLPLTTFPCVRWNKVKVGMPTCASLTNSDLVTRCLATRCSDRLFRPLIGMTCNITFFFCCHFVYVPRKLFGPFPPLSDYLMFSFDLDRKQYGPWPSTPPALFYSITPTLMRLRFSGLKRHKVCSRQVLVPVSTRKLFGIVNNIMFRIIQPTKCKSEVALVPRWTTAPTLLFIDIYVPE